MIFSGMPHSPIFSLPKCLHQILYLAIFSVFGTFRVLVGRPHFNIYINVKLGVVTKSTDIWRKGCTAKTKTVLKSMKKNGTTCSTCPFHQNENHCTDYVSDSILVVTNYLLIVMWFGLSPDCCQNGVDFQAGVHNFHSCTPPLDYRILAPKYAWSISVIVSVTLFVMNMLFPDFS